MNREQIAHDLAIVYLTNRYGVDVTGELTIESTTNYDIDAVRDVTGGGKVSTDRMPGVFDPRMVSVGTGKRALFGLGPEKVRLEPTDEFAVDRIFVQMIEDYRRAYQRFIDLLEQH